MKSNLLSSVKWSFFRKCSYIIQVVSNHQVKFCFEGYKSVNAMAGRASGVFRRFSRCVTRAVSVWVSAARDTGCYQRWSRWWVNQVWKTQEKTGIWTSNMTWWNCWRNVYLKHVICYLFDKYRNMSTRHKPAQQKRKCTINLYFHAIHKYLSVWFLKVSLVLI